MTKIKIISNPYKQEIKYETYKENAQEWIDAGLYNPNGRLREEDARKCFLPFNAKEILESIENDYYVENKGAVEIIFEGTKEEYNELIKVCEQNCFINKFNIIRSNRILDNGKFILNDTKEIFNKIKPVIENVVIDERDIAKKLIKVSDALDDIVPICVFGNYSTGKSTFINALIGREILPSGGEAVTAKAFKIQNLNQSDVAIIKFKHFDKIVELSYEDEEYRVLKGDSGDELLIELDKILKENEANTIDQMVVTSLKFINSYEKRDSVSKEIGNMIELYIPFSKVGIFGSSNNKFVIFDTPGSNTATNQDHIEVLKEALEGFSNGIPVWITNYENIDTIDNEKLCNDILNIDALDQRFTMIVINKAEDSDLPEDNFNEEQIKSIKELKSVEKMYASGIFFVSSIMGLGAKNNSEFMNTFYRKTYKKQFQYFSKPDEEFYIELYKYNIMPSQIKDSVISCLNNEKNIIYVNSGLHFIETEMEEFATKYSAYNKCQMVYSLLCEVIEKTTENIQKRIETRKKSRDSYIEQLEDKKKCLVNYMCEKEEQLYKNFDDKSLSSINESAKNLSKYECHLEKINQLNTKFIEENNTQLGVEEKINKLKIETEKSINDVKDSFKSFDSNDITNSISIIADETMKGFKNYFGSNKDLNETKREAFSKSADELIFKVNEIFKEDIIDANEKINDIACNYWKKCSLEYKNEMIAIVTESGALTDKQKQTLSNLIFNYRDIFYEDDNNDIFVKPKFLRFDLQMFEKLNTKKLAKKYNDELKENIKKIVEKMNNNYLISYKNWRDELSLIIENNIVDLNSDLQEKTDLINYENDKIKELETSRQKIKESLNEIENLISFKEID